MDGGSETHATEEGTSDPQRILKHKYHNSTFTVSNSGEHFVQAGKVTTRSESPSPPPVSESTEKSLYLPERHFKVGDLKPIPKTTLQKPARPYVDLTIIEDDNSENESNADEDSKSPAKAVSSSEKSASMPFGTGSATSESTEEEEDEEDELREDDDEVDELAEESVETPQTDDAGLNKDELGNQETVDTANRIEDTDPIINGSGIEELNEDCDSLERYSDAAEHIDSVAEQDAGTTEPKVLNLEHDRESADRIDDAMDHVMADDNAAIDSQNSQKETTEESVQERFVEEDTAADPSGKETTTDRRGEDNTTDQPENNLIQQPGAVQQVDHASLQNYSGNVELEIQAAEQDTLMAIGESDDSSGQLSTLKNLHEKHTTVVMRSEKEIPFKNQQLTPAGSSSSHQSSGNPNADVTYSAIHSNGDAAQNPAITDMDIDTDELNRNAIVQIHVPDHLANAETDSDDSRGIYPAAVEHIPDSPIALVDEDAAVLLSTANTGHTTNTEYHRRLLKTGYVYDIFMIYHASLDESEEHPEDPRRIFYIYRDIEKHGLFHDCLRIPIRKATHDEILTAHGRKHFRRMRATQNMKNPGDLVQLQDEYDSIYLNCHSFESGLYAAGGVIEACKAVVRNKVKNAFAIVRPPGHHAEPDAAMGFCVFNNVAVATRHCIQNEGVKRVLIVDWDVHFGNGTQKIFESDPNVLYVSLHRYDNGTFYPADRKGSEDNVGVAKGTTVNIPWPCDGMTDGDYIYAFHHIILPIAMEFGPDLVIVSAGFDAAEGDHIGQCNVTPAGYGQMTHMLKSLAGGRLVLALEGGYNLNSISVSARACMAVLLGEAPPPVLIHSPTSEGIKTVARVKRIQSRYWKSLERRI